MTPYKPVEVVAARDLADRFEKDVVVILAVDRAHDKTHVTTYGRTPHDKAEAAAIGDQFGRLLPEPTQWFEDFRTIDQAELVARAERAEAAAVDALGFVRYALEFFDWSRFPNLHERVEHLRDRLAGVKAGPEGGAR